MKGKYRTITQIHFSEMTMSYFSRPPMLPCAFSKAKTNLKQRKDDNRVSFPASIKSRPRLARDYLPNVGVPIHPWTCARNPAVCMSIIRSTAAEKLRSTARVGVYIEGARPVQNAPSSCRPDSVRFFEVVVFVESTFDLDFGERICADGVENFPAVGRLAMSRA